MWQTLRAELEYHATTVAAFGLLLVVSVGVAITLENGSVYAVIVNSSMTVLFIHFVIAKRRKREFFVRRAAMLPQSLASASWSRFSVIGALQSGNGLQRCRDRSELGFDRYLALGILGRNLHMLGRLVIARKDELCAAAKSLRRPQSAA